VAKDKAMKIVGFAAYVLFAVLVFLLGLVITFPVQEVAQRVTALASDRTGWQFQVHGVRWVPLAELRMARLDATPPKGAPVRVERVSLNFAPMRLREGVISVQHDMQLYGGGLAGHLDVEGQGVNAAYTWSGKWQGLDLSTVPLTAPGATPGGWVGGMTVTGRSNLDGSAAWRGQEVLRGNGRATVDAHNLLLKDLLTPLGKLNLPLGEVQAKIAWQRGRLDVESLTMDGDLLKGEGSGRITVGSTSLTTRLDMKFQATLGPAFPMRDVVRAMVKAGDGPVSVAIRGPIESPSVYINNVALDQLMLKGG